MQHDVRAERGAVDAWGCGLGVLLSICTTLDAQKGGARVSVVQADSVGMFLSDSVRDVRDVERSTP